MARLKPASVERDHGAGLMLESGQALRMGGDGGGQDLDRPLTAEARIRCAVDLAHSPCAGRRKDLMDAESGTGTERHRGNLPQAGGVRQADPPPGLPRSCDNVAGLMSTPPASSGPARAAVRAKDAAALAAHSRGELLTFLVVTFALSAIFYRIIIAGGGLEGPAGGWVFPLMWCPAVGALSARLVFHRNVRGLGWRWPAWRWAGLAYAVPIGYAIVAYGGVWLTGLGGVDLAKFELNPWLFVGMGTFSSLLLATGEEIGWRGFLVPALAERLSFTRTAVVSGLIWAVWHLPLIVFSDYNAGTPAWYGILCFAMSVIAVSFPLAWLRLHSGSLWPAAILHGVHNLYVQEFFDRVTVDRGATRWLTGEFGIALALTIGITAWLFWRARGSLAAIVPDSSAIPGTRSSEVRVRS